jgi:hypothetical protein
MNLEYFQSAREDIFFFGGVEECYIPLTLTPNLQIGSIMQIKPEAHLSRN